MFSRYLTSNSYRINMAVAGVCVSNVALKEHRSTEWFQTGGSLGYKLEQEHCGMFWKMCKAILAAVVTASESRWWGAGPPPVTPTAISSCTRKSDLEDQRWVFWSGTALSVVFPFRKLFLGYRGAPAPPTPEPRTQAMAGLRSSDRCQLFVYLCPLCSHAMTIYI